MTDEREIETELDSLGWQFDNTYGQLPELFHVSSRPVKVAAPRVAIVNQKLAAELGLNLANAKPETLAALFSGQVIPTGAQPLAQAYAGHQYAHFTMLGDGRAILLGEHRTPSGQLVDIQFKGSGPTAFSRRGDGRAALGPMLREYIISEAMAALGIPTTRSLAVVTTGEHVFRETRLQGAVLTRVAASHIRVGTFQYAAARQDELPVKQLADYTIQRHYPELNESPEVYQDFFREVLHRQARLIARWQLVGFVHGIMNTDNMSICGETIDYGPCAFMNTYKPETVFSSIDQSGRYAYVNQPAIAQWNLTRLAEALLTLFSPSEEEAIAIATKILATFPEVYTQAWLAGMRAKLGLQSSDPSDAELVQSLLSWMQSSQADFTNTFRDLSNNELPANPLFDQAEFQEWHTRWQQRLQQENRPRDVVVKQMRSANPAVIPRNHRVEEALAAAEDQNDFSVLHRLLAVLEKPFELSPENEKYREPSPDDRGYRTFCGT
ncbi:protein adenylyltransferase SelO [Schlesneria sp.]|uniref:protein adenylyltransferase SelO n=1 Tax=Schlesneria sp. TaxID=2762018 RepID=UPI002F029089